MKVEQSSALQFPIHLVCVQVRERERERKGGGRKRGRRKKERERKKGERGRGEISSNYICEDQLSPLTTNTKVHRPTIPHSSDNTTRK